MIAKRILSTLAHVTRKRAHADSWLDPAIHLAIIVSSLTAAFLLRFDFSIPPDVVPIVKEALCIALVVKLPIFELAGFHRSLWRFADVTDLFRIFVGNAAATILFTGVTLLWIGPAMPRSVVVIDALLCLLGTALVRLSVRLYNEVRPSEHNAQDCRAVLIYGAGAAGTQLLREIRSSPFVKYEVKGFLDDDPRKRNALIMGVPVFGSGREAALVMGRLKQRQIGIREIIIAMPSATGRQMQEVLSNCRAAKVPCKTIPGLDELLSGRVLSSQVRSLSVTDLLGRQPVQLDETPIRLSIAGRSVLITGAAGSIGSELCNQVARFNPARLIVFDQAESELFKIESHLRERFPDLELVAALGDIRDPDRVAEVLQQHSVDSIFHAAAYKHVPMMESHALEAAQNNILGTWNLVCAARRYRVASFLMISSDKAVNPTSVMGATKRVCERIVSAQLSGGRPGPTKCVSVRFGNVLGSSGSVVPIFQAQIAAGGPIKVTHPDMRRYFMATSEAVALVLQASTMGLGSEIFVLDMGEPIRIVDLAANMIRLAGLVPYEDIDIQFTGLRPGEKLFEETYGKTENTMPTYHEKIKIFQEAPLDWDQITEWITGLEELLDLREDGQFIAHLKKLVPEYSPDGNWNTWAAKNDAKDERRLPRPLPVSSEGLCNVAGGLE